MLLEENYDVELSHLVEHAAPADLHVAVLDRASQDARPASLADVDGSSEPPRTSCTPPPPVASSSAIPSRTGNTRERRMPADSSDPSPGAEHVPALGRPLRAPRPPRASRAAPTRTAEATPAARSRRTCRSRSAPRHRRPAVAERSTGARCSARSQAVPTVGWPANASSTAGVKIWISPRSASSTKTVSLSPSCAATPWRASRGTWAPSRKTASGLPPEPPAPQNTRSRW